MHLIRGVPWKCFALAWLLSSPAHAIIVDAPLPRGTVGLGLSSLYRQQPDKTREQRYRYDLLSLERLSPYLRLENRIGIARDTRPRSHYVQVHEHAYEFFSGLRLTYPYLFRYGLSFGPLLQWQETTISLQTDQKASVSHSTWQVGWQAQTSIDYAITRDWEITLFAAWQQRVLMRKSDFAFGVIVLLNNTIFQSKASRSSVAPASPAIRSEHNPGLE